MVEFTYNLSFTTPSQSTQYYSRHIILYLKLVTVQMKKKMKKTSIITNIIDTLNVDYRFY